MVCRKSAYAIELDIRLSKAVKDIKSGKYKLLYKAAKVLGLNRDTLTCHVKGGNCHTQACYAQQKLSYNQENTLLK